MSFLKTKLLLLSSIVLLILAQYTNDAIWAFIMAFATSLFIGSCSYLIVNSDKTEPRRLKIDSIKKICNVYRKDNGTLYVNRIEIDIVPREGKYYAYKNTKYIGMIHHFSNTLNDEISEAIYAKDGYVFVEYRIHRLFGI